MTGPTTRVQPSRGPEIAGNVMGLFVTLTMLICATLALTTGSGWATSVVLWIAVVQSALWLTMKVVKSR